MGSRTDFEQENARGELHRLFNAATQKVQDHGCMGHFGDVTIPALTTVLCEEIAQIATTDPELARLHRIDVVITVLREEIAERRNRGMDV